MLVGEVTKILRYLQTTVVLSPRHRALVEIQNGEWLGVVITADEGNPARNARLLDLRAHAQKRSSFVPFEGRPAMKRYARHHRVPSYRRPLADDWFERGEAGIRNHGLDSEL